MDILQTIATDCYIEHKNNTLLINETVRKHLNSLENNVILITSPSHNATIQFDARKRWLLVED